MNPFVLSGYSSGEYFCDREAETRAILAAVQNRNHRLIISPRRMGKTGLLRHCFEQPEIKKKNYCFLPSYLMEVKIGNKQDCQHYMRNNC